MYEWAEDYQQSAQWSAQWEATQTQGGEWPEGIRLHSGQMIYVGRVCVPETKVHDVLKQHHEFMGHAGVKRVVEEVTRRYHFPITTKIYESVREVKRQCVTCQACEPPNWNLSLPVSYNPVPDKIMTSVALDIFALPEVKWQEQVYDALLLCVDRMSGWVIARPCNKVGLTAEKAAHMVLDNGWESFGIPSVITSDRGPQFVGQWWRTMCARLGIRHAYSQAYRPQANGRAEVAGKTFISILRKLHTDKTINWVEALPRVVRIYHDNPGESGVSPFKILFGRDRNLAGVPYETPRECEGAQNFFNRMDELDRCIANTLNERHWKDAQRISAERIPPTPYQVGDWVWMLRPKGSHVSKLDTWWVGPAEVIQRVGDMSYQIRVKPGVIQDVHMDQLKPYTGDRVEGEAIELFHHMTGYIPMETGEEEWNVEKILKHRKGKGGSWEFLTKWEGAAPGEETWEPAQNFILRYCGEFIAYLRKHKIDVGMAEVLDDVLGERVIHV